MRSRKEIENQVYSTNGYDLAERTTIVSLEVLLDIRDLLTPPKINHKIYPNSGSPGTAGTPGITHCPDCTTDKGNVYYEGECPKHKQV